MQSNRRRMLLINAIDYHHHAIRPIVQLYNLQSMTLLHFRIVPDRPLHITTIVCLKVNTRRV
jgi:hypothetical protein